MVWKALSQQSSESADMTCVRCVINYVDSNANNKNDSGNVSGVNGNLTVEGDTGVLLLLLLLKEGQPRPTQVELVLAKPGLWWWPSGDIGAL